MSRILLPFDTAGLPVPQARVLYLNAQPGPVIGAFPALTCVQDMFPIWATLPEGSLSRPCDIAQPHAASLVDITRDRDQNRSLIATAWDHTQSGGQIVVSGAKTDGIDALIKELRRVLYVDGTLAKSHGKVVWLTKTEQTPDQIAAWRTLATPTQNQHGFWTAPGMFSQAKIDPGSQLLVDTLPAKLGSHIVDLGAGWGFLTSQILPRDTVERVDLIEASAAALDAARKNVTDPRCRFLWADATASAPLDAQADTVIMNPPFHTSRAAEPRLGQAFIATAARLLKPSGALYLVANRHLPYEAALQDLFRTTDRLSERAGFKILMARAPKPVGKHR